MGSLSRSVLMVFLALASSCTAQNSRQDFLAPHNSARALVGVEPLVWNIGLERYAEIAASRRIGDCVLFPSGGRLYGENLFRGTGRESSAVDAVKSWVEQKENYDYDSNTCEEGKVCKAYTQVVWRDTTDVGCAWMPCNSDVKHFVCSYDPPGNWNGQRPY